MHGEGSKPKTKRIGISLSRGDGIRKAPRILECEKRKLKERQPNQALQTTPVTRSVYEKTIEFGDPQRGV